MAIPKYDEMMLLLLLALAAGSGHRCAQERSLLEPSQRR